MEVDGGGGWVFVTEVDGEGVSSLLFFPSCFVVTEGGLAWIVVVCGAGWR